MPNIQIMEVKITLNQCLLKDVQYLKQHLDQILASSDKTIIENLIKETELLKYQAKDGSKTYWEIYQVFHQLNESWLNVWRLYKNRSEAVEIIDIIHKIINYFTAYSYLFLGLSYINEGRIGEYKTDLKRIVSGFYFLSETIDIFLDFFSASELGQIYNGAQNAFSSSVRNITEYFKDDLSSLVTQLRAYSSLIILKIERHLENRERNNNEEEQIKKDFSSKSREIQEPISTNSHRPMSDYYIPTESQPAKKDIESLGQSVMKLSNMLAEKVLSEDDIVADFKELRRQSN